MPQRKFKCVEGCSECCTIAPVYRDVWEKVTETFRPVVKVIDAPPIHGLRPAVFPITEDGICPLLTLEGKCSIYGSRHEVCKKFGLTKDAPCMFLRVNGETRTKKETETIRALWQERENQFFKGVKR